MMGKKLNSQIKPEVLIEHIEDAKGWLDKAGEYYKQANPTHAEMTLNLAQAEVRHAWELSRERYVTKSQMIVSKRNLNHLIVVAASILAFVSLAFGLQRGNINKYLAGVFKSTEKSVSTAPVLKPATVKIDQKLSKVDSLKTVKPSSIEPVSKVDKTVESVESRSSSSVAVETVRERPEFENVSDKVRLRQVSQFAIDEEALTKEASHSLRNGK